MKRPDFCTFLRPRAARSRGRARGGLTLVEMLVAMAIALLMMAAVVTVFANISKSVIHRRATIEMSGVLRNVREALSRDLEGATCPAVPWQRTESAVGYFEIIEGPLNDSFPSTWLWDSGDTDNGEPDGIGVSSLAAADRPRIDLTLSSLPGSNLRDAGTPADEEGRGLALGSNEALDEDFSTDGRALGDGDDTLMLTVRNEKRPFVGRVPRRRVNATGQSDPAMATLPNWGFEEIESPLAEVVWYSVENPPERNTTFAFGEPGFRTIYRRALLIAPWLEYRIRVSGRDGSLTTEPGVVRVLSQSIQRDEPHQAIASLIAFQERYDLSVRLEWDPHMPRPGLENGRWVLRANSLADLTKRENRYEHHGLVLSSSNDFTREYPFPLASFGSGYSGSSTLQFVLDPEYTAPTNDAAFDGVVQNGVAQEGVLDYQPNDSEGLSELLDTDRQYPTRPYAYVDEGGTSTTATARAYRNEDGSILYVTRGLVPLSGDRQGEDVMVTDALAFDLRVYDPGAPLYAYYSGGYNSSSPERADRIVQPGDPAWVEAFRLDIADGDVGDLTATNNAANPFTWERSGAYVDPGYGATHFVLTGSDRGKVLNNPFDRNALAVSPQGVQRDPLFFNDGELRATRLGSFAPGYSLYDTWSWHYETNGIDEDQDGITDQATNGLDDPGVYNGAYNATPVRGPDDPGERETRPPYDTPLRGVQVTIRAYERDSRQIRETMVRESFVPE